MSTMRDSAMQASTHAVEMMVGARERARRNFSVRTTWGAARCVHLSGSVTHLMPMSARIFWDRELSCPRGTAEGQVYLLSIFFVGCVDPVLVAGDQKIDRRLRPLLYLLCTIGNLRRSRPFPAFGRFDGFYTRSPFPPYPENTAFPLLFFLEQRDVHRLVSQKLLSGLFCSSTGRKGRR